jgi:uncharacterized membrane protein YagU involved in acid resistance
MYILLCLPYETYYFSLLFISINCFAQFSKTHYIPPLTAQNNLAGIIICIFPHQVLLPLISESLRTEMEAL